MKRPKSIQPGDKIRIVSPAGKLKPERVMPAVEYLKSKGYRIELGKHVFSNHFQFSGTDKQRLLDLQEAIDDAETAAIICARGGYGVVRIIDKLDFTKFKLHPKWLVGYSDVTVLHSAINNLGFESIHGTMPPFFFTKNGEVSESFNSLLTLISGKDAHYKFSSSVQKRTGKASGELIGGNLSIINSLLGTKYDIQSKGKILFLEDIDEHLYHLDRMMRQLKMAGKLENLAALVVGDFTEVKEEDPFGETLEEIIWEAVKDYDYPVCFGLKAGHDDLNLALTFGKQWEVNVSETVSILSTV